MKKATLFLTVLLIIACQNDNKLSSDLLTYDLTDLSEATEIKLSELGAEDIKYIPLETDSGSLMFKIKKLVKINDAYVINDYKRIISFTSDGKFISQVGKKGRGPKEYSFANDFSVNSNGNVYILSDDEDKIYVYNLNGKFLKYFNCPPQTTDIWNIDDAIFCFSANKNGTITNSFDILDNNGLVIRTFPNKYRYKPRKFYTVLSTECLLYKYQDETFVKEIFSDTVFKFKNDVITPAYIFNHTEELFPVKAREGKWGLEVFKKYIIQRKFFRTENNVYYEFTYKGNSYGFLGTLKGNKNSKLINLNKGIINDIDGGINFKFNLSDEDGTFIGWIDSHILKNHVTTEAFKNSTPKYPEKKKELEKLANSLNENDNPVLMLVKLKN